jgi:hypothetical protein
MRSFVSKQTVFNERAEASPGVRFKKTKSKAEDNRIDRMRVIPLWLVVEGEMACGRVAVCGRSEHARRGERMGLKGLMGLMGLSH